MRILFLYPNIRKESLIPPSIALLSRILKDEGIQVDIFDSTGYDIDLNMVDADRVRSENLQVIPTESIKKISRGDVFLGFANKIKDFNPDLIAMTSTESTFLLGVSLLKVIRESVQIPTVLGGVFATFAPDIALRYKEIDMCVLGEGEQTILNLCNAIEKGLDYSGLNGLWIKQTNGIKKNLLSPVVDINQNPTNLDISLFDDSRFYRPMGGKIYRMLSVETHRGCPYSCGYCNSPAQNKLFKDANAGRFFRKKNLDKVREELLFYRDTYDIEYVFFWADTFFAYTPKEFDEFCEMYSEIKLPFWCQTRPETVTDYRIRKLIDVGLERIAFGIEHGNERFRKEVIGRRCSNQIMIDSLKIVGESGVPFSVNNIIGFPGETRELVFDTIELNRKINTNSMSCSIFMPFHGTDLYRYSVDNKYISDDVICPSNNDEAIVNMSSMSKEEIKGLSRTFAMYSKFPKSRWQEIALAESMSDEGDDMWSKLRNEYLEKYVMV